MSGHVDTALDQLRLADDCAETPEQMHAGFLAAAQVHALLAVAEVVRQAGTDALVAHTPPQRDRGGWPTPSWEVIS